MNVQKLAAAATGRGIKLNRSNPPAHAAHGPLTVTIDHAAGSLFGFHRGAAGALFNYDGAGELGSPDMIAIGRTTGTIGSLLLIGIGIWLFARGWKSGSKWNLQTVAGFLMVGNGLGRVYELANPETTAVAWATLANGQFTKNK